MEKEFIRQLDDIVSIHEEFKLESKHKDLSDLPKDLRQALVTRAAAAITRISGTKSQYTQDLNEIRKNYPALHTQTSAVLGVVRALRGDIASGYLRTLEELVHASVLSDFIEMAEHLLTNGYKDAAAVIAVSVLERHLKDLSKKNNIKIVTESDNSKEKPQKAETLNAELVKEAVYSKLDQKNVTAWLGLRNEAAHGNYVNYNEEQVRQLIAGISEFVARFPA